MPRADTFRTLFGRFLVMREIARSIHQREMREGLREIADQPARARFVLLAEQSNIITQRQARWLNSRNASSRRPSMR